MGNPILATWNAKKYRPPLNVDTEDCDTQASGRAGEFRGREGTEVKPTKPARTGEEARGGLELCNPETNGIGFGGHTFPLGLPKRRAMAELETKGRD